MVIVSFFEKQPDIFSSEHRPYVPHGTKRIGEGSQSISRGIKLKSLHYFHQGS